jgi:hypothetical protein
LPPPGRVVSTLALPDVTTVINASDLQAGDAIHSADQGHIMLFAGWVVPGSRVAIMQEGDCGKVAEYKEYNVSSLSGDAIDFSWGSYRAKRYNGISFSCDRTAGPLTFSCDGEQAEQHCVNVTEPEDPDSWSDNFLCTGADLGMQWSSAGPMADMDCTNVVEPAEPHAAAWNDDYLCVPKQSPYALSYSNAGAIAGKSCVQLNEPADPGSWSDNYVCTEPVYAFSNAGFTFSGAGPVEGKTCVSVDEPGDPDTWSDNYFCSDEDVGLEWSNAGAIDGMTCVNVAEAAEPLADVWSDNFLCLPEDSDYELTWSSAGPLADQSCVRWFDHAETSGTWFDNWLCVKDLSAPAGTGGGWSGNGMSGSGSGGSASHGSAQHSQTIPMDEGCSIASGSSRNGSLFGLFVTASALLGFARRRR